MSDFANDVNFDDDLVNDIMNIVQNDDLTQDEQKDNEESFENENNNNMDDNSDMDSDLDEYEDMENEEIDKMLEKPIDILNEKDEVNFYTYDKVQIKSIYWRGLQDSMLPEGWVQMTHACGMPLYLHRQSRVCTLSRPYFIGQSSARKHDIPVTSIPCLAYKKRKETIEQQIKEHQMTKSASKFCLNNKNKDTPTPSTTTEQSQISENVETPILIESTSDDSILNNINTMKDKLNQKIVVSIQSNEEKSKESVLPPDKIHEYCKRLFEFDTIKVKKFKTWNDRKKFMRKTRNKKFPDNAKILKIQTKTHKGIHKDLNINLTNKTPLTILYEYASQIFKANPRFEIQEKENPKDPFQAFCYINDKLCGKGDGNSKKVAKNKSAEEALKVLIPEYKGSTEGKKNNADDMYTFFDSYAVEHSHIYTLAQKLGAPLPYDVLLTCLKYNFALNISRNRQDLIEEEIKPIKFRNCLYRMKLAQYEVEVNCTRKKEGRQFAAQKILKLMHPHVQTWGSILRLYGSKEAEYLKNESKEENTTVEEGKTNEEAKQAQKAKPNKELLDKLKEEMLKLRKPNTSNTNLSDSKTTRQDTLLTIPPLILPNQMPKLNEEKSSLDESSIIKFNDDFKTNKQTISLNRIVDDSDETTEQSDQNMDEDDDDDDE